MTARIAGTTIEASATFAVLDRTAPQVTITPPASTQVRAGADLKILVRVVDEIGISRVLFETAGIVTGDDSTVVASGTMDTSLSFDVSVPDNATVGSKITLYALAADLSQNEGAAAPVTLTVVP
ncbi:MAG: hypothetical protein H0T89_21935 [Deltaproteobacteria bacterium]|nr:hypothetical protein [Deltaproteobacteria bacterium]MDQ3297830.1 hypothetical protein [Myxococcota bacterium]